jgi:hypothetical protein
VVTLFSTERAFDLVAALGDVTMFAADGADQLRALVDGVAGVLAVPTLRIVLARLCQMSVAPAANAKEGSAVLGEVPVLPAGVADLGPALGARVSEMTAPHALEVATLSHLVSDLAAKGAHAHDGVHHGEFFYVLLRGKRKGKKLGGFFFPSSFFWNFLFVQKKKWQTFAPSPRV